MSSSGEEIGHGQDRHWTHIQPWGGDISWPEQILDPCATLDKRYVMVRTITGHMSSPGKKIQYVTVKKDIGHMSSPGEDICRG
jgi:hypothetical protein